MRWNRLLVVSLALSAAASACQRQTPSEPTNEPLIIPVSVPEQREVTDYVDFTGRMDAVHSVEIRPRVTGYLTKAPFKEGMEVKAGDLLYEIDPRPYQALVDYSQGQVAANQAQVKLAKANNVRAKSIAQKSPAAITQQDLDSYQAAEDEALANLAMSKGTLDTNELNLSFTKVLSPIDGEVSRYYYTVGNLVTQDTTVLTSVVSRDPIYAYFDIDEPTMLRIKNMINQGKLRSAREYDDIPVLAALQGEKGFPHHGYVNFVNNRVDPTTGTLTIRGEFHNPRPERGVRIFTPGNFVKVRLPLGQPHEALLVVDKAIGTDQGLKYVYVVDEKDQVQYRRVRTGALQEDGLRVIEDGLKPDDRVIVSGLQMVRPRMTVQAELTPMPKVSPLESGDIGGIEPGLEPQTPIEPAKEGAEKDSEANEKAADESAGD
ncbi:MAG TPA: efflux RND transporter periplasmic adaptor subunit [Pirellulales bacterium]|nr:efflux RND transporter periplasmic adaptor subunit [Pirellulales bacterium]